MADDQGKFVSRVFPLGVGAPQVQKPIFYKNAIYALAEGTGGIVTYKIALDAAGAAQDVKLVEKGTTKLDNCRISLATCFYRGQVYLFFDNDQRNWSFKIRYKTTTDPDTAGWLPQDGLGLETGLVGSYEHWGTSGHVPCIGVKELNDKLFLFYHRGGSIYLAVYDGATWKELHGMGGYHPNFALCTATLDQEPVIVFGGFPLSNQTSMYLSAIRGDGRVSHLGEAKFDGTQYNNMVSIAQGSIKDGTQANVLQIFAQTSHSGSKILRRATFNLKTGVQEAWVDTGIIGHYDWTKFSYCDAVYAAVPQKENGDFRQHLIVLSANSVTEPYETHLAIASYPSDYFRCEHTGEVDTKNEQTLEPGAWTLLGVVEGAPPFSRNGVDARDQTAVVEYGDIKSEKVAITEGFETSISSSLGGSVENVGGVTAELAASFAVANDIWDSETHKVIMTMSNKNRNHDGSDGWLVVSMPRLRGRRYSRLTQNETQALGTFFVVSVEAVSIEFVNYKLNDPPKGMRLRQPSSNLEVWRGSDFPVPKGVEKYQMNALKASLRGTNQGVVLELANGRKWTTRTTAAATLKANIARGLFNIEASASFNYSYATEVTCEFTKYISANLDLPDPGEEGGRTVTELVVTPFWLVAKEGARLDPAQKPFWMPEVYLSKGIIPWCLSWQVSRIEYEDGRILLGEAEPGGNTLAAGAL
jgi:hypothetical protein